MVWMNWQLNVTIVRGRAKGAEETLPKWRQSRHEIAPQKRAHQEQMWNWVICRDVDGPWVCHTEWIKSERENQTSYINTYIWILEKWYWWTHLQGRNRHADVKNEFVDTARGWGWDRLTDSVDIYTVLCINWQLVGSCCITQGAQLGALWWPRGVRWQEVWGRPEREEIYVHS